MTRELGRSVLGLYKLKDGISPKIRALVEEDFEKALAFLAQHKPGLPELENLQHKALFLDLTRLVPAVFWDKRMDPQVWRMNKPQVWLEELLAYWHKNRTAVITLNYDTLVERVASAVYGANRPKIPTGQLYPLPLTPTLLQGDSIEIDHGKVEHQTSTFKLLKLHGSINWLYSGRPDFSGEELFYIPCRRGLDGVFDNAGGKNPDNVDWRRLAGKFPLIVPPVLDKSGLFNHEALRSMWFQAGEALKRATRVVCLGYSLPDSDLAIAQFLKTCAPSNGMPFEIVDREPRTKEHFEGVLGKNLYELRQEHSGEACIPAFVIRNLIDDWRDKRRAALEIDWLKPTKH